LKYIGWSKGNTVNFIVATTLARHKVKTLGVGLMPFTYGTYTLVPQVRSHSPCYLVGSFEGGEIDALIKADVKATIIAKIYDRKYNIKNKQRIGNLIVYPVLKSDRAGGLEYLVALVTYFNVNEEVKFFEAMLSKKTPLSKVLTVLDLWEEAFKLFTSLEVIDDPTPSDVDRVIEYLKKRYNYDDVYSKLSEEVRNNIVVERRKFVAIDLGVNDPKRYMYLAQEMFPKKDVIALISRVPEAEIYKIVVLCPKRCSEKTKKRLAKALNGECRGGLKRFTIRVGIDRDLRSIAKAMADALLKQPTYINI